MREHGHYVQAINYPTVPRGQEKLRISPTPHHTVEMMDRFVDDLVKVWKGLGLPVKNNQCGKSCNICKKPLQFLDANETAELLERNCRLANCPQAVAV